MTFTEFVWYYCYCYYYLLLLLLQFLVGTTVVVHKSSSLLKSSAIMKGEITNSLKSPLMQTRSAFNVSRPLRFVPEKMWIMSFFLLNFLSKFIDMHRMVTILSIILLVSEMLEIQRAKVEAHFLKKLAFVTNKCLAEDAFRKCPRTRENHWEYTAVRE